MDGALNDSDHEGASLSQSPNLQQQEAIETLDGPVLEPASDPSFSGKGLSDHAAIIVQAPPIAHKRSTLRLSVEVAERIYAVLVWHSVPPDLYRATDKKRASSTIAQVSWAQYALRSLVNMARSSSVVSRRIAFR